ncbi:hypothetical protein BKA69DRAFT_1083045 [Paraphysoderma sedebokerense]|nr:hypothetical protein BKA69DRAFT_1083045 [Paraphysoderma sedebokerense]
MGLPGGPHANGGALATDVSWGWRQYIGFPLIPICLVLSRTRLADDVFPYLPVVFITGDSSGDYTDAFGRNREDFFGGLNWSEWMNEPNIPSGFLLALLPVVRHGYNGIMDRIAQLILSPSEKKKRPLSRSTSSTASATVDASAVIDDEDDEDNVVDLYQQRNKIGIGSMIAGGLLMPLFANRTATWLGYIPFVRDCLPKNTFARNLVAGALFVVAKDVLELWYTYEKGKYMRSRRVLDYAGPGSGRPFG